MESRQLAYHNGHFYDVATSRRIQPRSGAAFILIADHAHDLPAAAPAGEYFTDTRNAEELRQLAKSEGKKTIAMLPATTSLHFSVGNPNTPEAGPHIFRLELHEDLLLCADLGNNPQAEMPKDYGTLFHCRCVVHAPPTAFVFVEPIYAGSLNSAITRTLVHYFGNKGSTNRSALNVCETPKDGRLRDLRNVRAPLLWAL